MFNFEKLDARKKSIVVAKAFPADERFGLTTQMRRAAVSVSSDIAEGCSRSSQTDFRRFVEIATGSAFELVSQAHIARDQGLLPAGNHDKLHQSALAIVRMPSGLRASLRD